MDTLPGNTNSKIRQGRIELPVSTLGNQRHEFDDAAQKRPTETIAVAVSDLGQCRSPNDFRRRARLTGTGFDRGPTEPGGGSVRHPNVVHRSEESSFHRVLRSIDHFHDQSRVQLGDLYTGLDWKQPPWRHRGAPLTSEPTSAMTTIGLGY
jgi:hypothetical protein